MSMVAEEFHTTIVVLNTRNNPSQIWDLGYYPEKIVRNFNTHLSA